VLTRIKEPSGGQINLLQRAKAYNGEIDDADVVLQDGLVVVVVIREQAIEVELAGGVQRLFVVNGVRSVEFGVDRPDDLLALFDGDQHEGVVAGQDVTEIRSPERVHLALLARNPRGTGFDLVDESMDRFVSLSTAKDVFTVVK
jgi:hypothetical protein